MNKKILVFDTETTGIPSSKEHDTRKQPYIVQYAHAIIDTDGKNFDLEETRSILVKPPIPIERRAMEVHGITNERLENKLYIGAIMEEILSKMAKADIIAAHNAPFDLNMLYIEARRVGRHKEVLGLGNKVVDTMTASKSIVQAKDKNGNIKNPKLMEAYVHFFGKEFSGAHDALADVIATAQILETLYKRKILLLVNNE